MNPYEVVCREIALAAERHGRVPSEVTLVAVTKKVSWQTASILYQQGQRDFGEGQVAEALAKQQQAAHHCRWHFIGHLQKNKVRKVIGKFSLIHSVDSLGLAEKLSLASQEAGLITSILLQANTSGELSKQGLNPDEWRRCFEQVLGLEGISVKGLMTMAPLVDDEAILHDCFSKLRQLRDELRLMAGEKADLPHLSMGMSRDFKIAIGEGATLVRIGTALFPKEPSAM